MLSEWTMATTTSESGSSSSGSRACPRFDQQGSIPSSRSGPISPPRTASRRCLQAAALLLILSCAANSEPRITAGLLSRVPVCLTLGWGAGQRATFYSRPAPDTLTLLPDPGEAYTGPDSADAWGLVELVPSQQDRRGGGWWWSLKRDTLVIRGDNPTMDGLAIWSVHPDERAPANWREFGLRSEENSEFGRVGLRPYACPSPKK